MFTTGKAQVFQVFESNSKKIQQMTTGHSAQVASILPVP